MTYASGTEVSVERSKAEMDRLLGKHGATRRIMGVDEEQGVAFAMFEKDGRQVRLRVPVPTIAGLLDEAAKDPKKRPQRWWGWSADQRTSWARARRDQLERERWRQLILLVKAKLEMIALGLSTVEREFLADVFLADGRTVHETIKAAIDKNYLERGRRAAPAPRGWRTGLVEPRRES